MLRYDVTTDYWVIFAPKRAKRPHDLRRREPLSHETDSITHCPFCPGNEHLTPIEIAAFRPPGNSEISAWQVRTVPNLYPALVAGEPAEHREEGRLFHSMGGHGAHEVVVESPSHDLFLGEQPVEQVEAVLRMLRDRAERIMADHRVPMVAIFKNHGAEAGTSLRHPHWQIIGSPVVSRRLRTRLGLASQHFDRTGRNLYEHLRDEELADGRRVLLVDDQFVVFLPYASHFPFETWIVPRVPQASFLRAGDAQLRGLAEVLKRVLTRLHDGLGDPAFNLMIDMSPRGEERRGDFLWTVQIRPRLFAQAGFEMGSGMYINTVMPEDAAEYLRG